MYLTEPEVRTLLQRLTDRFGSGELVFDTLSLMGPRLSKVFAKGIVKWGIHDARESSNGTPAALPRADLCGSALRTHTLGAGEAAVAAAPRHASPELRNVLNRFAF